MTKALLPALAALLLVLPASALAQVNSDIQRPDLRPLLRELPRLDVYVDGERVFQDLAATQVGPLTFRDAGPHAVQVVPAGTPPDAGVGFGAAITTALPNQSRYLYFLSGSVLGGSVPGGAASGSGIALGDELPDPYYALYFHF